jgi:hypothetical protein
MQQVQSMSPTQRQAYLLYQKQQLELQMQMQSVQYELMMSGMSLPPQAQTSLFSNIPSSSSSTSSFGFHSVSQQMPQIQQHTQISSSSSSSRIDSPESGDDDEELRDQSEHKNHHMLQTKSSITGPISAVTRALGPPIPPTTTSATGKAMQAVAELIARPPQQYDVHTLRTRTTTPSTGEQAAQEAILRENIATLKLKKKDYGTLPPIRSLPIVPIQGTIEVPIKGMSTKQLTTKPPENISVGTPRINMTLLWDGANPNDTELAFKPADMKSDTIKKKNSSYNSDLTKHKQKEKNAQQHRSTQQQQQRSNLGFGQSIAETSLEGKDFGSESYQS